MSLRFARLSRVAMDCVPLTALLHDLLVLGVVVFGVLVTRAQNTNPDKAQDAAEKARPEPSRPKLGLLLNEANAYQGYTLLAPTNSTQTYLIDMQGRVVQTWKSDYNPGLVAYLLDNGNLLRTGQIPNPPFFGSGTGGGIAQCTCDGQRVRHSTYHTDPQLPNPPS